MKTMKVVTVGCLNDDMLKDLITFMYTKHLDFLQGLEPEKGKEMMLLDSVSVFGIERVTKLLTEHEFTDDSKEAKNFIRELSKAYINTIVPLEDGKSIKLCNTPNLSGEIRVLSVSDFEQFSDDIIICGEDNLPIEMEVAE